MMLTVINVIIFAILKAIADTIAHHPDTSIFNNTWWIKEGKILKPTKYKVDGWHIVNSFMAASFLANMFIKPTYNPFILYTICVIVFIAVFNLFYNKLFRLKGWKQ